MTFRIVERKPKYFTIITCGKYDNVSTDKLKSTYLALPTKKSTREFPTSSSDNKKKKNSFHTTPIHKSLLNQEDKSHDLPNSNYIQILPY